MQIRSENGTVRIKWYIDISKSQFASKSAAANFDTSADVQMGSEEYKWN